ncbi:acyl carrier protein [Amycolatopsis sp. NPDC051903]|uniref:acyl carrier protein n=1 Tax=Amycolatopsis sp. NPDC051903 TaxID=3363936 RepID=UPI00379975E1
MQYHSLKAGHDYGQYVRDAENADRQDIADFIRRVMEEDSARAKQCHEFISELSGTSESGPAVTWHPRGEVAAVGASPRVPFDRWPPR